MGLFGSIEDKHGVDDPGYEPPERSPEIVAEPEEQGPRYDINPFGLGLVLIGAAGIVLAAFLPLDETTGLFSTVRDNTLIQQGQWPFLLPAVVAAMFAYYSYSTGRRSWRPILLGVLGLLFAVKIGADKGLRTLYPIGPNGVLERSQQGTVASVGIAVYVAGAASLLTLVGGWVMRQSPEVDAQTSIACPDCAETILAAARVCKHCGYRVAVGVD